MQIRRSFNKASASYQAHCQLQKQSAQDLINYLCPFATKSVNFAADIGAGIGISSEILLQQLPIKNCLLVDIADQSLCLAKKRCLPNNLAIAADFQTPFVKTHSLDLMFANLSLHWGENLGHTLANLRSLLTKQGLLAFSVPLSGSLALLKEKHPFASLALLQDLLADWHILSQHCQHYHYDFPSAISALRSLKKTGVNINPKQAKKQGLTQGLTKVKHIEQLFYPSPSIYLNYKIAFFVVATNSYRNAEH